MCSPGQGNFCALEWNDLPVGREFDGKFWKNVNPHSMPSLTIPSSSGYKRNVVSFQLPRGWGHLATNGNVCLGEWEIEFEF